MKISQRALLSDLRIAEANDPSDWVKSVCRDAASEIRRLTRELRAARPKRRRLKGFTR